MPVINHRLRLVYLDVPKVACTSLKILFWEIEHGQPFPPPMPPRDRLRSVLSRFRLAQRPPRRSIQRVSGYKTQTWSKFERIPDGFETLVLLRDPAARLHSAWKNKVSRAAFIARGRDELTNIRRAGLPEDPDFGAFLERFEDYRQVSWEARVHTYPYARYLGPDPRAFDHVFHLEKMVALETFLSRRHGSPVKLRHENATHEETRNSALTPAQFDILRRLTEPEYDWLGPLYDTEAGLARFRPA